jgi:hypothetical protein
LTDTYVSTYCSFDPGSDLLLLALDASNNLQTRKKEEKEKEKKKKKQQKQKKKNVRLKKYYVYRCIGD